MARQHSGRRTGRFDDTSGGGWLDDRGVSEVIGSILVFGLLVTLLAVVQTQAVPNANNEVEVKHNNDVQGDIADLQSAIIRTGTLGGTQSTTVETGMTYPPRLVLFNPPSVQGTLETSDEERVLLYHLNATDPETEDYLTAGSTPSNPFAEWETSTLSYRVDYNRYSEAPTVRYEHTAVVNDYEDDATVESQGSLISGNRISLVLLRDGLEESQVRPASVTTYPVSAPAQTVDVESGDERSIIRLNTEIDESVWATELLADQYDTNAFPAAGTPAEQEECLIGSNAADQDDGRYVVGCNYVENSDAPNEISIYLQKQSSYDLAVSRVGFSSSPEPTDPAYLTNTTSTPKAVQFEIRDEYNNPVEQRVTVNATTGTLGTPSSLSNTTYTVGPNGQVAVERASEEQYVHLTSGPNAFDPTSGASCAGAPGCVVIESTSSASPVPDAVELTDAQVVGSDEIELTVRNDGSTQRQVVGVQLNYITVYDKKTAVGDATLTDVLGNTLVGSVSDTDVTDVLDGPNRVTDFGVGSTTSSLGTAAEENKAPSEFTASSYPPIPPSSPETLSLVFDEEFGADTADGNFNDGDSVLVSVTITYEDGRRETYATQLHT